MSDNIVTIDCELKHETELAYLVDIDGDEFWVPKSQSVYNESYGELQIAEWLATQKGMI